MINTQYIHLNMIPSGVLPVLHCSQYDVGRPLGVVVHNGSELVDLSQYTATIEATRTDGTAIITTVTASGTFATTATMTNKADRYFAQLVLVQNGQRVASLPFVMCVVPAAMDENSEAIQEDASLYQQFSTSMQSTLANVTSESAANSARIDNLIALQTAGSMQGSKITTFIAQSAAQFTSSGDWQSFSFCDYSLHLNTTPAMSVLDGLSNPVLLSAGAYVLASQSASITDEPVYVNLTDDVRFYNHGYLGAAPDKRAVEINMPKVTDAAGNISGMWLLFTFSVVSDVPVDLSEITDARIGADGTTYATLGTAIRTQVSELSDDSDAIIELLNGNYDKLLNLEWEQGAITAQGEELDMTTRIRTGYIDIGFFSYAIIKKTNSYESYVLFYDANKNVLTHDGWAGGDRRTLSCSTALYMRIVLRKPNNAEDIAPSDGSNCTANGVYTINPLSVQSVANNAMSDIHSGVFLSSKVIYVRAYLRNVLSELPQIYTDENINSAFVVTLPISIAGTSTADAYYQQFLYNNSIKKVFFRVFGFPDGQYTIVRDWESSSGSGTQYLSGKTGIVLGDSISYGLYSYWDGTDRKNSDGLSPDRAPTRISDYFAMLADMTLSNIAARGTGYVADTRNLGNALVKANATDFSNYDFVMLCFGINDWIRNAPLGTIADNVEGTVCGNLIRVLQKIYSDNPLCKVVIYTPYNAWGQVAVNQGINILYGNESTNYALGTQNTAGYTLQTLIDTIKSVADYYGVTCTGLGDSNVVNRINIKDIMIDGLHPSLDSLPMLAAEMYAQKDFG